MITHEINYFMRGLALAASLIIVIGAQNAYVLNQGLKQRHIILVPTLCVVFDIIFIAIGVGGLGYLIQQNPKLIEIARWFGAIFLFSYGLLYLYYAFQERELSKSERSGQSIKAVIVAVMALTLLNPGVYLDTIVLIGSVGAQYQGQERLAFALGAMSASILWFYSLAWGAKKLSPLLRSAAGWRVIEVITALIMWTVAFSLVYKTF